MGFRYAFGGRTGGIPTDGIFAVRCAGKRMQAQGLLRSTNLTDNDPAWEPTARLLDSWYAA